MFFLFDLRVNAILGGTSMRVIDTAFRYYLTWHGEKSRGTEFKPCVVWRNRAPQHTPGAHPPLRLSLPHSRSVLWISSKLRGSTNMCLPWFTVH